MNLCLVGDNSCGLVMMEFHIRDRKTKSLSGSVLECTHVNAEWEHELTSETETFVFLPPSIDTSILDFSIRQCVMNLTTQYLDVGQYATLEQKTFHSFELDSIALFPILNQPETPIRHHTCKNDSVSIHRGPKGQSLTLSTHTGAISNRANKFHRYRRPIITSPFTRA